MSDMNTPVDADHLQDPLLDDRVESAGAFTTSPALSERLNAHRPGPIAIPPPKKTNEDSSSAAKAKKPSRSKADRAAAKRNEDKKPSRAVDEGTYLPTAYGPCTEGVLLQDKLRNNVRSPALLGGVYIVAALLVAGIVALAFSVDFGPETTASFAVDPPSSVVLGQVWPYFAVQLKNNEGLPVKHAEVRLRMLPLGDTEIPIFANGELAAQVSIACITSRFAPLSAQGVDHRNLCDPASTGAFTPATAQTDELGTAGFHGAQLAQGRAGSYILIASYRDEKEDRSADVDGPHGSEAFAFLTVASPLRAVRMSNTTKLIPSVISIGDEVTATVEFDADPTHIIAPQHMLQAQAQAIATQKPVVIERDDAVVAADWLTIHATPAVENARKPQFPLSILDPRIGTYSTFANKQSRVFTKLTVMPDPADPLSTIATFTGNTTVAATLTGASTKDVYVAVTIWGTMYVVLTENTLQGGGMVPPILVPPITIRTPTAAVAGLTAVVAVNGRSLNLSNIAVAHVVPEGASIEMSAHTADASVYDGQCFASLYSSPMNTVAAGPMSLMSASVVPKAFGAPVGYTPGRVRSVLSVEGGVGLYEIRVSCDGVVATWGSSGKKSLHLNVTRLEGLQASLQDPTADRNRTQAEALYAAGKVPYEVLASSWLDPPRIRVARGASAVPGKYAAMEVAFDLVGSLENLANGTVVASQSRISDGQGWVSFDIVQVVECPGLLRTVELLVPFAVVVDQERVGVIWRVIVASAKNELPTAVTAMEPKPEQIRDSYGQLLPEDVALAIAKDRQRVSPFGFRGQTAPRGSEAETATGAPPRAGECNYVSFHDFPTLIVVGEIISYTLVARDVYGQPVPNAVLLFDVALTAQQGSLSVGPDGTVTSTTSVQGIGIAVQAVYTVKCNESTALNFGTKLANAAVFTILPRSVPNVTARASPTQGGAMTLDFVKTNWTGVNDQNPIRLDLTVVWSAAFSSWYYPLNAVRRIAALRNVTSRSQLDGGRYLTVDVSERDFSDDLIVGPRAAVLRVDGYPIAGSMFYVASPGDVARLRIVRSVFANYAVTPVPLPGSTGFLSNRTVNVVSNGIGFRYPFTTKPTVALYDAAGARYKDRPVFLVAQMGASPDLVEPTVDAPSIQWLKPFTAVEDVPLGILVGGNESEYATSQPVSSPSNLTTGEVEFPYLGMIGADTTMWFYMRYCYYVAAPSSEGVPPGDGPTTCVVENRVVRFPARLQPKLSVQASPLTITTIAGVLLPPFVVTVSSPQASADEQPVLHIVSAYAPASSGFRNERTFGVVFNGSTSVIDEAFYFIAATPPGAITVRILSAGCEANITVLITNKASAINTGPVARQVGLGRPLSLDIEVDGVIGGGRIAGHLANKLIAVSVERAVRDDEVPPPCSMGRCGILAAASTTFGSTGTIGNPVLPATLTFDEAETGNYTIKLTVADAVTKDAARQLLRRAVINAGAFYGVTLDELPWIMSNLPDAPPRAAFDARALLAIAESEPVRAEVAQPYNKSSTSPMSASATLLAVIKLEFAALGRLIRGEPVSSGNGGSGKGPLTKVVGPFLVVNPVASVSVIFEHDVDITSEHFGSSFSVTTSKIMTFDAPSVTVSDASGGGVQGVPVTVYAYDAESGVVSDGLDVRFDLGVWTKWITNGQGAYPKSPSQSEMLDAGRTFPTTDEFGTVTLVGLILIPRRAGTYHLAYNSRGSPAAIGNATVRVKVVTLSLFESLKIFAIVFAVVFTPLFAANVPGSGIVPNTLAVVITIVGTGIMIYEATQHSQSGTLMEIYVHLTLTCACLVTIGYVLIFFKTFTRGRIARVSRKNRAKSRMTRYFSTAAYEGDIRAHDAFEYTRWITTARIDAQIQADAEERERVSMIPTSELPFGKRVAIYLDGVKLAFNRCMNRLDLDSEEREGHKKRNAVVDKAALLREARSDVDRAATCGSAGILAAVEPRPPLRKPDHIPLPAYIPVNLVIVAGFAMVFTIVGTLAGWYLYYKATGEIIKLINYLPDPSSVSPEQEAVANFALTEALSAVVSGLTSQFPQFSFLASVASSVRGVNIVSALASIRSFLHSMMGYLLAAFAVGTAVADLAVILTFVLTFSRAPGIILRLRRGELKEFAAFRTPSVATLEAYVGQHLMHTLFLFVIAFVLSSVATLIVAIPLTRSFLIQKLFVVVIVAIGTYITATILRNTIMRGLLSGWLLQRPAMHALYSFADLMLGLFHSVMAPLTRWGEAIAFMTLSFANLETSIFPAPLAFLDGAAKLYQGTLAAEAKYSNPIFLAFASSLLVERTLKRIAAVKIARRRDRLAIAGAKKAAAGIEDEASMCTTADGAATPSTKQPLFETDADAKAFMAKGQWGHRKATEQKLFRNMDFAEEAELLDTYGDGDMRRILVSIEDFTLAGHMTSARINSLCRIWLRSLSRIDTDPAVWPFRSCTDSEDDAHSSSEEADTDLLSPRSRLVASVASDERTLASEVAKLRQQLKEAVNADAAVSDIVALQSSLTSADDAHKRAVFARIVSDVGSKSRFFDVLAHLRKRRNGLHGTPRRVQRWWLFVVLHRNPSLRLYRKHALALLLDPSSSAEGAE